MSRPRQCPHCRREIPDLGFAYEDDAGRLWHPGCVTALLAACAPEFDGYGPEGPLGAVIKLPPRGGKKGRKK